MQTDRAYKFTNILIFENEINLKILIAIGKATSPSPDMEVLGFNRIWEVSKPSPDVKVLGPYFIGPLG